MKPAHTCRACGAQTRTFLDFGEVALAGAFLTREQCGLEPRYPLSVGWCPDCLLVQANETVDPRTLFGRYFYHSSATDTMRRHFARTARDLVRRFKPASVLEIGCNDGVLMRPLLAAGVPKVVGIDPAGLASDDLVVVRSFWGKGMAEVCDAPFDLIVANNVFAHMPDLNAACAEIERALVPHGTFVFEVNRLDSLVSELQYDWIYHEHAHYFSLLALENLLAQHGMEVYDLEAIPTHAGSARYFAARFGDFPISTAVRRQRDRERWLGLNRLDGFKSFADRVHAHRQELCSLVQSFDRVVGYGACGRTNTLLQYAGIGAERIACIADDAPAKQGYYTPGTHIPIVAGSDLPADADCMVVFAWSFLPEIAPKIAAFPGAVYVPLPVHIYEHKGRAAA